MLRRLHPEQPDSFAFTEANQAWAEAQMTKYPEGRQASAIIPLLWRAQEQEGWLSKPAIEYVADMLDMAYIRALEVATFYFMFQLQPVGSVAHIQICGTTSCMICGAEDLIAVCRDKIAANPHELSPDGKFSWEEVECLGACANAPMAQIGKDYYEDLTSDGFAQMLDDFAAGKVPVPGPQNGRYTSEPLGGLTSLKEYEEGRPDHNASVALAVDLEDTIKRIDGTEVPLITPWTGDVSSAREQGKEVAAKAAEHRVKANAAADAMEDADHGEEAEEAAKAKAEAEEQAKAAAEAEKQEAGDNAAEKALKPAESTAGNENPTPNDEDIPEGGTRPEALDGPRDGQADDLKKIKGVGPKLEKLCNSLGFYHFDQVANWSAAEVAWVDENLEGFKGRVTRDNWVEQARVLAAGGETEFSKRAKY